MTRDDTDNSVLRVFHGVGAWVTAFDPNALQARGSLMRLQDRVLECRSPMHDDKYWTAWTNDPVGERVSIDQGIAERRYDYVLLDQLRFSRRPRPARASMSMASAPDLPVGCHYPRIWRPIDGPDPQESGQYEAWLAAGTASSSLLESLRHVFRHVEPHEKNASTFSLELRELLILACTEVEASLKGVLRANCDRSDQPNMPYYYCKLAGPMRLSEWEVALQMYPSFGRIRPFAAWHVIGEEKPPPLPWYKDHHAVKHDRENELERATLLNVVSALAGVWVLMLAQFGPAALDAYAVPPLVRFQVTNSPRWHPTQCYWRPLQKDVPWRARMLFSGA